MTNKEVKDLIFNIMVARFPEFNHPFGRDDVEYEVEHHAHALRSWCGRYGGVSFVFREIFNKKGDSVSLRCVGLWVNCLLVDTLRTPEWEATFRSRLPYEEEFLK